MARAWSDRVNRSLCSPYYTILVRQEAAEREEGHATLLKGLARFSEELELRGGPFFFGDQVSIVDLTLVPWAFRYYVLPECCGPEFAVPRGDEKLAPFWRWFDAIMACAQTLLVLLHSVLRKKGKRFTGGFGGCRLPAVARTLPDKARYLDRTTPFPAHAPFAKTATICRQTTRPIGSRLRGRTLLLSLPSFVARRHPEVCRRLRPLEGRERGAARGGGARVRR